MEDLTHFNINHLKFFFDAASLGSVSKAARKNLVSQSAISQGIKSLEGALSCQLLEHRKSRFALTEKGEKVFVEAKSIMRSLVILQKKVRLEGQDPVGHLFFGIVPCLANSFLADVYIQSRNLYPGIALHARYGEHGYLKESLLKRRIEMAVVYKSDAFSDFSYTPVSTGYYRIYKTPENQDSPSTKGVLIPESVEADFAQLKSGYQNLKGEDLRLISTLPGWDMVEKLIRLGHGFGVLPDFIVSSRKLNLQAYGHQDLKIPYEIGIIHNYDRGLPDYLKIFIELFRSNVLCNNVPV